MHKKAASLLLGAAVLASAPATGHTAELLLNGSFETPVVAPSTGPNSNPGLNQVPTPWTITGGGQSNIVNGNAYGNTANGTGSTTVTLGADPYDKHTDGSATSGQQALDISTAGTAFETFKPTINGPATVKFDIGRRDLTASNGSTWTLTYTNASGTVVTAATSSAALNPASGWLTQTSTAVNLLAGTTYTFTVNLDNADEVDGLSIAQVPEPTTAAATGLGLSLLGWLGYKRRRRS